MTEFVMRYYVNAQGGYMGASDMPIEGGIEVPFGPNDARQIWNFTDEVWGPIPLDLPMVTWAVQSRIDEVAGIKGYRTGDSLMTYWNSTVAEWAQHAVVFNAWRDSVWIYAYAELEKVQTGVRPTPALADLILELPASPWSVTETAAKKG